MTNLIEQFNALYPYYKAEHIINGNCLIEEKENNNKPKCFQRLILKGFDGWKVHRDFPKDASSFYQKSQMLAQTKKFHDLLRLDCDGILYKETTSSISIYCLELKSSYSVEEIVKAQKQIIGSYLKLNVQMSLLEAYLKKPIVVYGVIVAYEANAERLTTLLKQTDDPKERFCRQLYASQSLTMCSSKLCQFWSPLNCPDLTIKLVKVPTNHPQHEIDFSSIQ